MMKRRIGTVLGLGALLMVTGCGQGGTGIALLDEPATEPLEADAWEGIDPQSVRFVADHEGVTYYLATPADPELDGGVCLVAGEPGAIACGGPSSAGPPPGSPVLTLDFGTGEAAVFRDGAETSDLTVEGWTQVHENLLVRDSNGVS